MLIRFLIAAAVSFLLSALGHYYLYVRLIEPLTAPGDRAWPAVFLCLWALTFFGFAVARAVPVGLRRVVELAMFLWMGTGYLFLLLCVLSSPLSLGLHFFGASEAWLAGFILLAGGSLTAVSLWSALSGEKIVRCDVPVRADLPAGVEDLTVVVLSDIHVAGLIGRRRMRALARKVNALSPDLVFVTGDLVDGTVRQLRRDVLPLGAIKPAHGVYYVTGNHEYYCNAARWRTFCSEELGWNVLSNANRGVEANGVSLRIYGIEDRSSLHGRGGVRKHDTRLVDAVAGVGEDARAAALNILLAHQPKDTRTLGAAPWMDVQVSGHTHAGQLWPLQLFVLSDQKFNRGLYTLETGTRLYVNQGTGFWGPPMRLGTRCEISVLRFVRTASGARAEKATA